MPFFLIITIEIFVRLLILAACVIGAYFLFAGMKNSHPILGSLVGILALIVVFNIFVPSSYAAKNRMTFQHTYTAAEKKANRRHAVAASESRIAASESRAKESSIEKVAAAKQHIKETTGLSGLKYQVKKAMKGNSIQQYDITVLGQTENKPYSANVFLQDKDVAGFKYDNAKTDAVTVLNGIQHFDYKEYKKIGIIFTADTINSYGNKDKKTPLVKYQFMPNRIEKIDTENVDNLAPIANYYWKSDIADKR